VVREGQAADVLLAEARKADLLVVGSRGLGGFRALLLGSVSQQCARHAACPVMIVPPPHEHEEWGVEDTGGIRHEARSTREVSEAVAETLAEKGLEVDVRLA
jgi:hypothetical protein